MRQSAIRKLRLNNLCTEDVCKKLNISKSMLYKIETGYRKPSRELIAKMSNVYGITMDEIFKALPNKGKAPKKGEEELNEGLRTEAECLLEKRICSFVEYYSEMVDEDIRFISDEQLFEKFKNFAIIMEWDYPSMTTTAFIYRCPIISKCIVSRAYSIELIREQISFDKDKSEKQIC